MRIIAGRFRGARLAAVGKGDANAHLRPTTDRVRESLFNVLTQHDVLDQARVLDLFAGTGALGLEALSRGAAQVTFVENGRAAQRLIGQNIAKLKVAEKTDLLRRDACRLPGRTGSAFDLVFLDPPYRKGLGEIALSRAMEGGWLSSGAIIVWEEAAVIQPPIGMSILDQRTYGDTTISLLSKDTS